MSAVSSPHALRCPTDTQPDIEALMSRHASLFIWNADHHTNVAMNILCRLRGGPPSLAGKAILEIGYGQAPVLGVIASGLHAQSYSVEYSSTMWLSRLHVPFYEALHARLARISAAGTFGQTFDSHAATAFGRNCGRAKGGMHLLTTTSERLEGVPDSSIDLSLSNAVFEHIEDVNATFAALSRVSRLGSLTCHQVDLRHHKDFSRPWDFLLIPNHRWKAADGLHSGNRLRLQEFLDAAHHSGWRTVAVNLQHEPISRKAKDYAAKTLSQLRNCAHCKYQNWPRRDLDGCTANGMPMTSVLFCAEYVGRDAVDSEPARGACGQDSWIREGYTGWHWPAFNSSTDRCQ